MLTQLDRCSAPSPHDPRRGVRHRRAARARRRPPGTCCRGRDVGAVRAARRGSRSSSRSSAASATVAGRPRPGAADDAPAADEDGRRRGALQRRRSRRGFSLFAVGPFEQLPERERRSTSPSRTCSRSSPTDSLERPGPGRSTSSQARVRSEVRPGQLRADRRRHLLVVPADGRASAFADRCWSLRAACWLVRRGARSSARAGSCALAVRGDGAAVPRQRDRLALHRDGAPAVGRPGAPADDQDAVSPSVSRPGRSASRSPASSLALRRARRGRGLADRPHARKARAAPPARPTSRRAGAEPRPRAGLLEATHDYSEPRRRFWFVLIGVLWIGYFVLEGFDFGVGMLLRVLGRDEAERGARASTRSARSGTATRSGCSSPAAPPSPPSRTGTRRCSPASTSPSS